MYYKSPDGEEGFPGALTVIVTFQLVGSSLEVKFRYQISPFEKYFLINNDDVLCTKFGP